MINTTKLTISEDVEKNNILVVDDEPEIRDMIADFLSDEDYNVYSAPDAKTALNEVLGKEKIDLVLSDINMPGMKGFELLNKVQEIYPEIKRILITAYNVENYMELALKYDVGNIFVKSTPFNFNELKTLIYNLVKNDIFGIKKYFEPDNDTFKSYLIKQGKQLESEAQKIVSGLPIIDKTSKIELVIIELLANAIFYGARKESAVQKQNWNFDFELSDAEAISVVSMYDSEKFAISITDKGGKLKKHDVLYWLHRQLAFDSGGLPIGIYDSHGRGFYIARQYIDRLIVNIDRNKQTEIIIINYFSDIYSGFKPLYINEI